MSILSDKEIKELCTAPTFMITVVSLLTTHPTYTLNTKEMPTDMSEFEIKEAIINAENSDTGIKSYRTLTSEEKEKYNEI